MIPIVCGGNRAGLFSPSATAVRDRKVRVSRCDHFVARAYGQSSPAIQTA
jgi:hypothetical protein